LIKKNAIDEDDGEKEEQKDVSLTPGKVNRPSLEKERFRSMSMISKPQDKKYLGDSTIKNKGKFDLLALFKGSKEKTNKSKIAKTIDKFADEKASHFVNLKKLKKKDPFSSDILENAQIRSLSRTFTGKMDALRPPGLMRLNDSFLNTASTPLANGKSSKMIKNKDLFDDFPQPEEIKEDDEEDEDIVGRSMSMLGDFYDSTALNIRKSVILKDPFSSSPTYNKKHNSYADSQEGRCDLSTQLRVNTKNALMVDDTAIIEDSKSVSQEDIDLDEDKKSEEG